MKIKSRNIPLILGILCAIGVYFVLFTSGGHRLQSALIESDLASRAQLYLTAEGRTLKFTSGITATNVTSLKGMLQFDSDKVVIDNCTSKNGNVALIPTDGVLAFALEFSAPFEIKKKTNILECRLTTLVNDERVVNLTDVSLLMTDGTEDLTSEGTGEF